MQTTDLISQYEQTGDPAVLDRLISACNRDQKLLHRLAMRNAELYRTVQDSRSLLAEAKEVIEEREKGELQVVAFIGEGPVNGGGARTALIDRGGQRCVAPISSELDIERLSEQPMALLNRDNVVVGLLDSCESPSQEGRVVEAGPKQALVEFHADERVRLDVRRSLRGQLREGDRVLVDRRHGLVADCLGQVEQQSEWMLERAPRERFNDVAAQDEAARMIRERVFYSFEHPQLMDLFKLNRSSGILLYGPSGCGKTLLGRATAGELSERFGQECVFLRVKAGALKSKWYGDTVRRIQSLWRFARAEAKQGRIVVIFLDECDSLGGARAAYGQEYDLRADHDATNAWLSEMDGIDSDHSQQILCISSTNFESCLDTAFLSRFAVQLQIRRPDAEGASRLFDLHLNHGAPLEHALRHMVEQSVGYIFDEDNALAWAHLRDGKQIETIRRSHLVTGRLVRDVVEKGKWMAVRDVIERDDKPVLRASHLRRAMEEQFNELARKLTPYNVAEFVDLPGLRDGQVTRIAPIVSALSNLSYVA